MRNLQTLLALLLLAATAPVAAQTPAEWKAGAAAVVVTPREPMWMAGFASRDKPSEGVATDLRVKALALEERGGARLVIVTADLISFNRSMAEAIAQRCRAQHGIERHRLLLNASHTHSGPVMSLGGGAQGSKRTAAQQQAIENYTRSVVDKTVDVVGRAIADLAPATVSFGQGLAGFAVNRRRSRPASRQFPGPVDHDVPVLAVRAPDGRLRAVLFGYGCHPTTLDAYQINADYPGYAQAALEKSHPGVVALFVQGCGADQNPLPRFHSRDPVLVQRSVELSTMYGKILAAAVDLVLRDKMAPVAGPARTAFEYVDIPFEPLPSREELEARRKDPDVNRRAQAERLIRALDAGTKLPAAHPYAIQVCQFASGLKLIALSGEVVVDYALRLKAAHGWEDTWVAGYSNEVPGYIPSRRVLLEGGYETSGGPGGAYSTAIEEIIVERAGAMVRRTGGR